MLRLILSVVVLTSIFACTNRDAFNALKVERINDCYRQPLSTQDQCLQEARALDYSAYQRERDKVLSEETERVSNSN